MRARERTLLLVIYPPLLVLAGAEWVLQSREPVLLRDISVHVRALIAMPLILMAEVTLARRCRECVERFGRDFAIGGPAALRTATQHAGALRDSRLFELLLLAGAVSAGLAALWSSKEPSALVGWYCLITLPASLFLLLRATWRWLVWCYLLLLLSRLEARALPLHPDSAGGLSFLRLPVAGLSLIALAVNSIASGKWLTKVMFDGARASDFKAPLLLLVLVELALAFGPLAAFMPTIQRAWLRGVRLHGRLADETTLAFDQRWVGPRRQRTLLDTGDASSLYDYGSMLAVLEKRRLVPFGPRDVARVAICAMLPAIPLVLTEVSVAEALKWVAHTLVGAG